MAKHRRSARQERIVLLMDGSNFYHRLRDPDLSLRRILDFDYRGFGGWLAHGREIVWCRYYVGLIRREQGNAKSDQLVREQQRLFARLKAQDWDVVTGYMMKHGHDYKEKGVDVRIALDLLDGAYQNVFDTAILVSSDTDLIPAIERVQPLGKTVEFIGFSHRPSYGLIRTANIRRLLTRADLEPFSSQHTDHIRRSRG